MQNRSFRHTLLTFLMATTTVFTYAADSQSVKESLNIGWASADITPNKPVVISGGNSARISTGVDDPLTVTALALEAPYQKNTCPLIMVSCDLRQVPDVYRDGVRAALKKSLPEVPSEAIFLNATHSHTAPPLGSIEGFGIKLPAMLEEEYKDFAISRIVHAVEQAWKNRKPGGISFGLTHAMIGQNRLIAEQSGKSKMYANTDTPAFSHVEGYEDHSVNVLCTWDRDQKLTGMLLNVGVPSQVNMFTQLSADYWYNVRLEFKKRWGPDLFILPQCSAAGDQSPRVLVDIKAEERMERLSGQNRQKTIADRLANSVDSIYAILQKNIEWQPMLAQHTEIVPLTRRFLNEEDNKTAKADEERYGKEFEKLSAELAKDPTLAEKREWYIDTTAVYRKFNQGRIVQKRYELQKTEPHFMAELRVIRIGDLVMATNPFELYVDYGMQIKSRSKAEQTFLVQLAGRGTYVPTARSIQGGAYGAIPSSTEIGPEGGKELVDWTVDAIAKLWEQPQNP